MSKFPRRRSYNHDLAKRQCSKESSISQEPSSEEEESVLSMLEGDVDCIDFSNRNILNDISDLFIFCKEKINSQFINVLIYMSLRRFGHSWRDVDAFLGTVGCMIARTAHKWSNILVNRDFDEFINEEREAGNMVIHYGFVIPI
jgi:hypothetical protein